MTTAAAEKSRDELRRRQREAFAMRSGRPELNRSDLTFTRYTVIHEPTGDEYQINRGAVDSAIGPTYPVTAYFYDQAGNVVFLEPLPGGRR